MGLMEVGKGWDFLAMQVFGHTAEHLVHVFVGVANHQETHLFPADYIFPRSKARGI